MPAILVKSHTPFVFGNNASNPLENSVVLEIDKMYYKFFLINKKFNFNQELLNKNF